MSEYQKRRLDVQYSCLTYSRPKPEFLKHPAPKTQDPSKSDSADVLNVIIVDHESTL